MGSSLNPNAQPFLFPSPRPVPPPAYPTYDHQHPQPFVPRTPSYAHTYYHPDHPPYLNANYMGPRSVHIPVAVGPRRYMTQTNEHMQQQENHMNTEASSSEHNNGSHVIPFPSTPEELERFPATTVEMRNIPHYLRMEDLLEILSKHCWEDNQYLQRMQNEMKGKRKVVLHPDQRRSEFDFVHLPMEFICRKFSNVDRISNQGYALVNFTTPTAALRFYRHFQNRKWKKRPSCQETYKVACAKIQGKTALKGHFRNMIFGCPSKKYLPAVVEPACDGSELPNLFPVGNLYDPSLHGGQFSGDQLLMRGSI